MAKDTSIGIDIGSRYIKIVKLKKSGANIKIDDYIIHKLDFTPEESTSVDLKNKKIASVIKQLFKEHKLKQENMVSVLPEEAINIRFFTMPVLSEKSLKEAIFWGGMPEYIPFDLKDMVWDIQVSRWYRRKAELDADGKQKMDVTLIVAKKEMIASHLQLFEELNIVPDVLEAPSMAMANFLYFNLSQVEGKEGIAIINLGAKASSLNIIEGQTLRFNLDFPWAGDDLTLAIAQKLNLDCDNRSDVSSDLNVDIVQKTDANFDKADEIKRTLDFGGLINDPNGHSEQSEESQEIASPESTLSEENVVRNDEQIDKEILPQLEIKLKDLVRQVSGALKYYESRPDSKPVAKIYLSGGNSKLANLGIYLQAKLERNVEILDKPNPRLRISKKAELSDCLPILDIAIGAALRRLIQFKNTINLLPFEHLLQRKLKSKRSNVITIFCVLFLIILGGIWFKTKEKSNLKNELKIAREKLNTLTPQTKELIAMKNTMDKVSAFENELKNVNIGNKGNLQTYVEFCNMLPSNIWIEEYTIRNTGGIRIDGKVKSEFRSEIDELMFKCEGSKYFKGVQTASLIDTGGILDFSLARRDKSQAETSPVKGRE